MTLGYGQKQLRIYTSHDSLHGRADTVCGVRCEQCWCCYCDRPQCCCQGSFCDHNQATHREGTFASGSFLRKRAARLLPIYYLTNVASALLLPSISLYGALLSCFLVTSWGLTVPLNGVTWTISTMTMFYLVYPSLAPRLQRLKVDKLRSFCVVMYLGQIAAMLLGGLGTAILLDNVEGGYWFSRLFPPFRLPVFIMGCCCAFGVHTVTSPPAPRRT